MKDRICEMPVESCPYTMKNESSGSDLRLILGGYQNDNNIRTLTNGEQTGYLGQADCIYRIGSFLKKLSTLTIKESIVPIHE